MIIKHLLPLSLLTLEALACDVTLPSQLLILGEDLSGKNVYETKNCEANVLDDLHQIVTGLEGRVAAFQLKELMQSRGHTVELGPQTIQIQQLGSLIRDQLNLPTGTQVKKTSSVNRDGILALPAGDRVEVSCSSCLFGSAQPLTLTVVGFDGSRHNLYAKADFVKMVKAYKLTTSLASFTALTDGSVLKEEYIEHIPHADLITDLETLKFYKTNKPLRTGDVIKKSDLMAVNLVRAGLKTDVVLENQLIRIKTSGISRSNGSIGELVEVFHPQKNKKYLGKVIDINKVLVEL